MSGENAFAKKATFEKGLFTAASISISRWPYRRLAPAAWWVRSPSGKRKSHIKQTAKSPANRAFRSED